MRVVALEEHFTVPALVRRIDPGAISRRGFRPRKAPAKGTCERHLRKARTRSNSCANPQAIWLAR